MKKVSFLPGLFVFTFFAGKAVALDVGDPAPPLQAMAWLNGEPVTEFKKGQIYVVEFWATWCKPCVDALFHSSDLDLKYAGKVKFIGVYSEGLGPQKADADYVSGIKKFVNKRGAKITSVIAVDDPWMQTMYKSWTVAAGKRGDVGGAFIVDGAGKIAWVDGGGSGGRGIDKPLEQVLNGNLDLAAARANHVAQLEMRRARNAEPGQVVMGPINAALEKYDYLAAFQKTERLLTNGVHDDVLFAKLSRAHLLALLHIDEKRGLTTARELLANERYRRVVDERRIFAQFGTWHDVGTALLTEGLSQEAYRFALGCLQQAMKESRPANEWESLARAYRLLGDLQQAVQSQQRAVDFAEQMHRANPNVYLYKREFIDMLRDNLEKYQDELAAVRAE